MNKVIDRGTYCHQCKLFLKDKELHDWECWCAAEDWQDVEVVMKSREKLNAGEK